MPISASAETDLRDRIGAWLEHYMLDNDEAVAAMERVIVEIKNRT